MSTEEAIRTENFQVCIEQKTELFLHKRLGLTYRIDPQATGHEPKSMTAGGMILMEARDINQDESNKFYRHVRIVFHGGKDCWMLEDEHVSPYRILPRNDHFGTLSDMMQIFYDLTGIMPKPVTIQDVGWGIRVAEAGKRDSVAPGNPWQYLPGATYSIKRGNRSHSKTELWEVAITKDLMGSVLLHRIDPAPAIYEPYPVAIFTGEEMLSLILQRCAELTNWIELDHSSVRCFIGTDFEKPQNWVACVADGPKIRITPYDPSNPLAEGWAWKKPDGDLAFQESKEWCDSQLVEMGYQIADMTESQFPRPRA